MSGEGIGARLRRKEDDRFMRGRGEYVGDIKLAGMQDVAFLRSPVAHGRLVKVDIPDAIRDRVFTADDLAGVSAIRAVSRLPGFKPSEQFPLARGKVRHVGELIAMCVAPTRGQAEDLVAQLDVEIEPLPAIADMLAARKPGTALVHEDWGDNLFLETLVEDDIASVAQRAAVKVTREFRTARQCMSPIEGRGVVAEWNSRLEQLLVYSSAQMTHITRSGLSECLGLDEGRVRVVAPDVGGGFGYKGILLPEEVCLGWATRKLGFPLRWLEDRRENLTASANCREHHYIVTAYADAEGKLLAIDAEATVDSGAYSSYPFSACLEAAQVASILPGVYDFPAYRCHTFSAATNKPPILPYRGVARTGVCFAMELIIDAVARELGMESTEVRMRNLVRPEQMPFDNITKKHFDSGDYPESLRRAIENIGLATIRERQTRAEPDGRLIGVGFAMYSEQAAHGTSVYAGWGIPFVPGYEQAFIRFTPDGGLEIRIGVHSHGQGMETTMSQVAHEILGVPHDRIKVIHGDTALTPYSTGTWGSRSMVMAGGAVAEACDQLGVRIRKIAAKLLQCSVEEVRQRGRRVARAVRLDEDRGRRPCLVPPAAGSAARYRPGRPGGHRRLQAGARFGHLQLREPRRHRRRRSADRRAGNPGLRHRRGRRRAGQSDDRRRPDLRRRRAGHRHRALRGDGVRRRRPAARLDAGRLHAARPVRGAVHRHRSHGDAFALYAVRRQGHRRRRGDRAARRDHQRYQRRAADARCGTERQPGDAAAYRRGDCLGRAADERPAGRGGGGLMKPVDFAYERPTDLDEAFVLLFEAENAKILAGGQTLGPMLNLRLAQPDLLVDITRLSELTAFELDRDSVVLGACITHAAIEDGRVEDFTGGLLPKVARGIAYRAVRNRGTIGGSIVHADPAADWLCCFMALDASLSIGGPSGPREPKLTDFVQGALATDLAADEMVMDFRLPRLSKDARCGFAKICRKEGEFADAIGVYVSDPQRGSDRLVAGAVGGKPLVLDGANLGAGAGIGELIERLREAGYRAGDYDMQIHAVALKRALAEAFAA